MILTVINSNSNGNAYVLQPEGGDKHSLLIECGIHLSKIKKSLNYNLSNTTAIVSHSHGDHALSIAPVLLSGITVYASAATLEATGTNKHHRAKVITPFDTFSVGSFKIKSFPVNHDVPCLGFIIEHEESGRILFLTDTYYTDYTFPGLNNILVECNHDPAIMRDNGTAHSLQNRVIQSHMNLNTCKDLLQANDLSQVNNIVLIHLSDRNSDAARFHKEISSCTGKTVWIAEGGLSIPFNKTPF